MPNRHNLVPGEVKVYFNREGKGNRYGALTKVAIASDYEKIGFE